MLSDWKIGEDDCHLFQNNILEKSEEYIKMMQSREYLDEDCYISHNYIKKLIVYMALSFAVENDFIKIPNKLYTDIMKEESLFGSKTLDQILNSSNSIKIRDFFNNELFGSDGKKAIRQIVILDRMINGVIDRDKYNNEGTLAKLILDNISYIKFLMIAETFEVDIQMIRKLEIKNSLIDKFEKIIYEEKTRLRGRTFVHSNHRKYKTIKLKHNGTSCSLENGLIPLAIVKVGTKYEVGTGFVISSDGYFVTSARLADNEKSTWVTVVFEDSNNVAEASLIYKNAQLDIALFQFCDKAADYYLDLEYALLLPELGEEVAVFGYFYTNDPSEDNSFLKNVSMYRGYVSSNQIIDGNSLTYIEFPIKDGNLGGPVISLKTGKVIGICLGSYYGNQMPYMVPIQHLVKLFL